MQWFTIDTTAIIRLNINKSSLERLRNHPYINFYQAGFLLNTVKREEVLLTWTGFRLYEEFTEEDLEKNITLHNI